MWSTARSIRRGCAPRTPTPAIMAVAAIAIAAVAACSRRAPPLPRLDGELIHVVVAASLAPDHGSAAPPVAPLILDSLSFSRLGTVAGREPFDATEISRQLARPAVLVDPADVLLCPQRQPCRVRDDATYITIWEAERIAGGIDLVVSRTFNVQGLQPLTRSVVHRLRLADRGNGWQLTGRWLLPS